MTNRSGTHSLRRRLLATVLSAIALAALAQGVSAYRGALRQADAMFDYHLQQLAFALRGGPPLAVPLLEDDGRAGADTTIQIWGPDGVQLFQSRRRVLPPHAVLGFSEVTHDGIRYRVYALQTPEQTIQIAQDMDERLARARALALRAVAPMAVVAPLLMLVLWWTIRRSLDPVERTRQQVAARAADDLAPLPETGLPDEVRPLVQEINALFARLQTAFEAQQAFVAHAAHELRSPLTALKLQAQALERTGDEAARRQGLERLRQGIDRAIRLMQQLLVLARQEARPGEAAADAPVALDALVRQVVAECLPAAHEAVVDLGVREAAPLAVAGDEEALRIALRNLLENALRHTPAGGRIDVALGRDSAGTTLVVEDSGPGIPEGERGQVLARFARGSQALGAGSGLGLAIVQAVARSHGAELRLDGSPTLGGLRVSLRLPAHRTTPSA